MKRKRSARRQLRRQRELPRLLLYHLPELFRSSCSGKVLTIFDRRRERAAGPALEINPARNAGQDFHFKETVRKKDERSRMKAGMCDQCTEVRGFGLSSTLSEN